MKGNNYEEKCAFRYCNCPRINKNTVLMSGEAEQKKENTILFTLGGIFNSASTPFNVNSHNTSSDEPETSTIYAMTVWRSPARVRVITEFTRDLRLSWVFVNNYLDTNTSVMTFVTTRGRSKWKNILCSRPSYSICFSLDRALCCNVSYCNKVNLLL